MISTSAGDNWLVFVIKCNKQDFVDVIDTVWTVVDFVLPVEESIPHYMIREATREHIIMSFRVLRDGVEPVDDPKLIEALQTQLSQFQNTELHLSGNTFVKYHAWIPTGLKDENWTFERCKALHDLSRFAADNLSNGLLRTDGNSEALQMIRLFCNMMAFRETSQEYVDMLK